MKKTITISLALVMMTAFISGCSAKQEVKATEEIQHEEEIIDNVEAATEKESELVKSLSETKPEEHSDHKPDSPEEDSEHVQTEQEYENNKTSDAAGISFKELKEKTAEAVKQIESSAQRYINDPMQTNIGGYDIEKKMNMEVFIDKEGQSHITTSQTGTIDGVSDESYSMYTDMYTVKEDDIWVCYSKTGSSESETGEWYKGEGSRMDSPVDLLAEIDETCDPVVKTDSIDGLKVYIVEARANTENNPLNDTIEGILGGIGNQVTAFYYFNADTFLPVMYRTSADIQDIEMKMYMEVYFVGFNTVNGISAPDEANK